MTINNLSFKANTVITSTRIINNEPIKVDVYAELPAEGGFQLVAPNPVLHGMPAFNKFAMFINDDIEISSDEYHQYLSMWYKSFIANKVNFDGSRVLIVGGGDHQLATFISGISTYDVIDVVDPLSDLIGSMLKNFAPTMFSKNTEHSVFFYLYMFDDWYKDLSPEYQGLYKNICIDLSDDHGQMNMNDGIFNPLFMSNVLSLLATDGILTMYHRDPNLVSTILPDGYSIKTVTTEYINSYEQECSIISISRDKCDPVQLDLPF